VTKQLQKTYANQFEADKASVFCIDNMDYQDPEFSLDLASTGIPQLRHFCYSVPAKALFRAAHNFLENLLPPLIESVQLWFEINGSKGRSKSTSNLIDLKQLRAV